MSRWPKVTLEQVLTQYREYIDSPEPREYPKLSVKLYGKGVVLDAPADGTGLKMKRHQLAKPGQVILSEIWGKKGAIGFVPPEGAGALCTSHFFLFDVDTSKLDPSWLQAIFTANYLEPQLEVRAFGTTGYASVRPRDLLALEMPLPPIDEQRRIAERLHRASQSVDALTRASDITGRGCSSLLNRSASLIFDAALARASIPIRAAVAFERGRFTHRPRNDPQFFGGQHPWIQIGEIEAADKFIQGWTQTLNDRGLGVSRKYPAGTVLISIAATIGSVGILGFDCCVPDSVVAALPTDDVDGEFVYYYLAYLRSHLEVLAPQSAQKNINLKILESLPFPRVSHDEQRRIVAFLDRIRTQCSTVAGIQTQRSALVHALMPAFVAQAFN